MINQQINREGCVYDTFDPSEIGRMILYIYSIRHHVMEGDSIR